MAELFASYAKAYEDIRRQQQLERVALLKQLLLDLIPDADVDELVVMVGRCAHYHWGHRRKLPEAEQRIYTFLQQNQLNPSTVYRWFRLCIVPEDVRQRIESGMLTHKQALRLSANRRRQRDGSLRWQFMGAACKAVREALAQR